MASGTPLNDIDRQGWLISLGEAVVKKLERGGDKSAVFVTCSALKKKYRDILRIAVLDEPDLNVGFVYLESGGRGFDAAGGEEGRALYEERDGEGPDGNIGGARVREGCDGA